MILRLMRNDLASPMALLLSIACAALLITAPSVGLLLALPFFFMIWAAMPRRGSRFEAALPIEGRQIVLARMFSTLTVVLLPIAAWMIAQMTRAQHRTTIPEMLEYAAIATLAVMLPTLQRPGDLTEPALWRIGGAWILLTGASIAIVDALSPVVGLSLLAIAIAAAGYALVTATPSALQVAPIAIASERSENALPSAGAQPAQRRSDAWRLVARSMFSPQTLLFVPLLILGSSMGTWAFYLFLATLSVTAAVRYRTRWMSALPISNHVRLFVLLMPTVILSLACFAVGRMIPDASFEARRLIEQNAPSSTHDRRYKKNRTQVPLENWSRVANGSDPVITAPWGETVDADTMSILGVTLANPYSTGERSSERFVEWQFERATSAVFGRPIAMASYDSARVLPPKLLASPRMQLLNLAALVTSLLLLIFVTELSHWNVFTRQTRIPNLGDVVSLVLIGAVVVFYFYYYTRRNANVVLSMAEIGLRWLSDRLPANPLALVLVALLPVVLVYSLLVWQFDRSELTRRIKPRAV